MTIYSYFIDIHCVTASAEQLHFVSIINDGKDILVLNQQDSFTNMIADSSGSGSGSGSVISRILSRI